MIRILNIGRSVKFSAYAGLALLASAIGDMSIVKVGGVPRFAIDGKPVSATAVMPSPAGLPGSAKDVLRSFRNAGVRVASDVWSMHDRRYNPRQWWKDEGVYDFEEFDAIAHGLTEVASDELIFPRIKIDPPAKWSARHPEEMMDGLSPRPESAAWRRLYRGMLKDMIEHVEKSDYAHRVIGYHLGAFHCGEWLVPNRKSPKEPAYAEATCGRREFLPPYSSIAARRASIGQRSEAVADMLIDAASCVKELTGGRKLVCAFFGYNSVGHEKISKVLRSGKIDFIAAPPHYYRYREIGQSGRSQTYLQASYRLHNVVYFEETDYRTILSDPNFAPAPRTRRRSLWEANEIIRRSIGKSLAGGWENWWFLIGGNETYSSPELMESIRIGAKEAERSLETAQWKPAEVAVFTAADEYLTSGGGTHIRSVYNKCKCDVHRDLLPFCGVPFDSYELSDIADPRLPDYKVYVFPNTFTLTGEMRERIKRVVRRPGKTAIWFFAPGYYDGAGEGGVSLVEDIVGVPVKLRTLDSNCPYDRQIVPVGSSICRNDGWQSIFMPEPAAPSTVRNAFRDAGVHVWMDSDDVFSAGRGYVTVHASSDGNKVVKLPEVSNVSEIFAASHDREGVEAIRENMRKGETRVWRLNVP